MKKRFEMMNLCVNKKDKLTQCEETKMFINGLKNQIKEEFARQNDNDLEQKIEIIADLEHFKKEQSSSKFKSIKSNSPNQKYCSFHNTNEYRTKNQ